MSAEDANRLLISTSTTFIRTEAKAARETIFQMQQMLLKRWL